MPFKRSRGRHLINECDAQSKLIRKSLEDKKKAISTMKHVGKEALIVDNEPCNRGIKVLVYLIDSNETAMKICREKFKKHSKMVDLQVRR